MSARVLLVEDDPALARSLRDNFVAEGWDVEQVGRGDLVMQAHERWRPDVVVLDLMLPGRPGLEVLRELRGASEALPILILTARGEVTDRVVGLELGADDYVAKPFALPELLARVRALLRRAAQPRQAVREITLGGVRFDFAALGSSDASLTTHDVLVMKVLAERRGVAVPRADIVEEVCGLDSSSTLRTVDNHVMALRRALGEDPRRPRFLISVRGIGYMLARDDGS